MLKKGCSEVLRGRICPRCGRQFFICRHCDRGHVYCCRLCSCSSRTEKTRGYRKRYRMSKEGREQHQDMARNRRRRIALRQNSVGDQGSVSGGCSATVFALRRMVAMSAVIGRLSLESEDNAEVCCEICGRTGVFVRFGWGGGRDETRAGFSRKNL